MVNLLPAVLLGGPPHAGKSVLLYNLTHALQELGVRHHAIRACPDGEGNWYQEGDLETMNTIRVPGKWTEAFIQQTSLSLEHRCLPFLVDMGGTPKERDVPLFSQCTHAVLLVKDDDPEATKCWHAMVDKANLQLLAQLTSQLHGTSTITSLAVPFEGSITSLERHSQLVREEPVFQMLVERIADLFNSFSPLQLEQTYLQQAPFEEPIDLPTALRRYTNSTWWQREMLAPFLASLPRQTPLSTHGKAPSWLYAALAVHDDTQPFYLFDPKLPFGWVTPAKVRFGTEQSPEITIKVHMYDAITVLNITFPYDRIGYFQPEPLAFPSIERDKGLIFDGRIPNWLLTALVRLYKEAGVAWIAVYYPQSQKAIIVYSRVERYNPGDAVPKPSA